LGREFGSQRRDDEVVGRDRRRGRGAVGSRGRVERAEEPDPIATFREAGEGRFVDIAEVASRDEPNGLVGPAGTFDDHGNFAGGRRQTLVLKADFDRYGAAGLELVFGDADHDGPAASLGEGEEAERLY